MRVDLWKILESFQGRTVLPYQKGSGGGTLQILWSLQVKENILPSSTNLATYTKYYWWELLDMVMVCHHLDPKIPEDVSLPNHVFRKQMTAEDILHDMGV